MLAIWLVLSAVSLYGLSGFAAYLFPRRSVVGQRFTFAFMLAGSLLGLAGLVLNALGLGGASSLDAAWLLPWGHFSVALDPLSDFFLALIFVVPTLGSAFGLGYWGQDTHFENGKRLGLAFGFLAGAMGLVVLSRDGVLFLLAWEIMALAAYFAVTTDDGDPEVRRAGWVYLVATHMGTLCLLVMFGLWANESGSFSLTACPGLPLEAASVIFVLSLVGFGFKAGFMPLHFWLPGAHANAPSHVSAVMSGVMLKMGVYGILRMTSLLPVASEWWGIAVLLVGVVTGVLGIAFALGQQDIKRLLAYSSIENLGIIGMGVGLALVGRYTGRADWVLLGLGGALLHVWNHGLFKPLLFFNAGAVIHQNHTRAIDQMGGLGKTMPATFALFVVGAVAISGLPPLNGFVGEWLVYLGLFHTLQAGGGTNLVAVAVAASALALIGALAVATFVKLTAAVFLGGAKDPEHKPGRDPAAALLGPMAALAGACLAIGLASPVLAPVLQAAVQAWAPQAVFASPLAQLAPTGWISAVGAGLLVAVGLLFLILRAKSSSKEAQRVLTWDCGYAKPTPRMQYTGSSLTDSLVKLFSFALWPKQAPPTRRKIFASKWSFHRQVPDVVLDRFLMPFARFVGKQLLRVHVFQSGQTHVYVLYVLVITIFLFAVAGFWRPS